MVEKNIKSSLEKANPWWSSKTAIPSIPEYERKLLNTLMDFKNEKAIVLLGPRQSGKTTLMVQIIRRMVRNIDTHSLVYAPMDRFKGASVDEVIEAHQDLTGKFSGSYYFFDEVHHDKNWSTNLKAQIDSKTGNCFIATGSSATLLLKDISESGLGRFEFEHLMPFSFREYVFINDTEPGINFTIETIENALKDELLLISEQRRLEPLLRKYLLYGGFPAQFTHDYELSGWQKHLRQNYVSLSIYKDILQHYEVRDPAVLEDLLYLVAEKSTLPLSYDSIARSFGIRIETARSYLNYLESAGLIISCEYFTKNVLKRQRRNKKFYVIDPGFNTSLNYSDTLLDETVSKNIETAVACHLLSSLRRSTGLLHVKLQYWRNKYEVDFIIDSGVGLLPIEVKYMDDIGIKQLRGLLEIMEKHGMKKGIVITKNVGEKRIIDGKEILLVPASIFLAGIDG